MRLSGTVRDADVAQPVRGEPGEEERKAEQVRATGHAEAETEMRAMSAMGAAFWSPVDETDFRESIREGFRFFVREPAQVHENDNGCGR